MKTDLMYGIVANSKTRVRCVYCGVFIPKAAKCIAQHTNGAKHKENIELMSENAITFIEEVLYCKLCKINLSDEESVSKHIESEDHSNWMAAVDDLIDGEFINVDGYLSSEKDDLHCEVCHTNISCSLHSIQEHVNDFNHRSNIVEKLKPLNGIFPVDNDDEVWCKVCDTYIDNTVQSILDHIDDDEQHMEWFVEMEDLIEDHDMSLKSYLSIENELHAYCNKCQIEVLCNTENIESHVNSESHLHQFS